DDSLHGSLLTGWADCLCTRLVPYRHIVGKLGSCTDVELLPKPVQHPMSILIANNPKEGCTTPVLRFVAPNLHDQLQRCIAEVLPAFRRPVSARLPSGHPTGQAYTTASGV